MTSPSFSFFKKIGHSFSAKGVLSFWYRHYGKLFVFGFFVVLGIGAWNWYYSLYKYQLSDDEKRQYVEQYFKETAFKETKFRDVVNALTTRARMHEETVKLNRNIFKSSSATPQN